MRGGDAVAAVGKEAYLRLRGHPVGLACSCPQAVGAGAAVKRWHLTTHGKCGSRKVTMHAFNVFFSRAMAKAPTGARPVHRSQT